MSKTLAQILAEITTNIPDNTTGLVTPAITRTTLSDFANSCMEATTLNVKANFGAKGDGTTDDSPAFLAALAALSAGGLLYIPAGTYVLNSGVITPSSNTTIQGAGVDATVLKVTGMFPNNVPIQIPMTLTGTGPGGFTNPTTYAINAPTLGATSVTTTTAANAGNFNPGDIIMVSGNTNGTSFWYPAWYTTVVSSNAGTGQITLAETLPFGGSLITTVQKILNLPSNIVVRDMTILGGSAGNGGSAIQCQGGKNFLFENLKIIPGSGGNGTANAVYGIHKNSTFRHIIMEGQANPLELFNSYDCTIEDCHITNGYILVNGCTDCSVINNTVVDPQNNGSSGDGISVGPATNDGTARTRIIGNKVSGIPSSFTGISSHDQPDALRYHTVIGNTVIGANTTSTTGINVSDGVCIGNVFINLQNGIQFEGASSGANPLIEGNYFDTATSTPVNPFTSPSLFRNRQSPGPIQPMPGGSTSPQVQGSLTYTLTQGGAQNVSSFNGGVPGDEIVVITRDGNTTFVNGANLTMKGGVNYNAPNNTVMTFVCFAGGSPPQWFEKSRSQ